MTTMKLFIIPWLVMSSMVEAQDVAGGAVAAPSHQFVDIPFYQFLQRQNQINNAILLNNAMLANSLGGVPKEHQIRLPNTMPFSAANLQAGLPTSPPLFQNFQHQIPAVPATGLYDVLHHGLPVNPILVPTPTPPPSTTTSVVESTSPPQQHAQKTVQIVPVASKEDDVKETESHESTEESKKVSDRSARPDKQSADTIRRSSLRELVEEIGYETYGTTKQKVKQQVTTPKPRQDVYKLLRTLNLTEEETDDFVSHVEKVVREELVKKLAETRLAALNSTRAQEKNTTTTLSPNTTVEATTVPTQSEVVDRVEPPLRRTKTDKELLLYLPRKKVETEIKHHPPRVEEKTTEEKTDFVEAEILTSQMHLPIEERLVDDKGEEDFSGSEESAKIEETVRTTTTETTSTTTVVTLKPPTSQPTRPPPTLRIWDGVNGTVIDESTRAERRSYGGADADLLGIGLATGAPLDLEVEGSRVVPYRIRNIPRTSSPESPPVPVPHNQPHARAKSTAKPKTAFERLAVDYKERLTGAGDMDKILKTLYSNAYIALVDAKEAPNVRLPLNIRRAELQYAQRLQ